MEEKRLIKKGRQTVEDQMHTPSVTHVENRARRLHDMIQRLAINPAGFARLDGGDAYAVAREKCLKCVFANECLGWLSDKNAKTKNLTPAEFCPNAAIFNKCPKEL